MDMKEFKYVQAILEYGNISKAAEALFISQPSLSTYVRNIEKRLDIQFFEKVNGKLVPTTEGQTYLEYGSKILQLNQELTQVLDHMNELKTGIVRIGVTITNGASILPGLFAAADKKLPGITIKVTEASPRDLEKMVYQRELDFILVNHPFKEYENLLYEKLNDEEVVLMVPADNPVCKTVVDYPDYAYPWIDMKNCKDEKFILLKKGQRLRQVADTAFEDAGFEPDVLFETSNALTSYYSTISGIGLSFLITKDYFLRDNSKVLFCLFGQPNQMRIIHKFVLAYPQGAYLSKAARAVADVIKEIISSE